MPMPDEGFTMPAGSDTMLTYDREVADVSRVVEIHTSQVSVVRASLCMCPEPPLSEWLES